MLRGMEMRAGVKAGGLAIWASLSACAPSRSPYDLYYPMPEHVPLSVERYRLENGMEVLLSDDHTIPFVGVDLWYHVGSKDDPPRRAGLAHLFEHLMFNGSRHVKPYEHERLLAQAGARDVNGHTTRDHTSYVETVPANQLELAFWLESDRMAYMLEGLDQGKLERERATVENELRERYENEPYGMVSQFLSEALFPSPHPYHDLPIGTIAQLESVTLDDARAFARSFYVPNQCTLAVVGDFDAVAVKALIAKYFGSVPSGAPSPSVPDVAPALWNGEKKLVIEADVPRARIVVAWPVVPRFAPGSSELELGAPTLAGYLSKELVEGEKLATEISAWMELGHLASTFEVRMDLAPSVAPQVALAALDDRLHHIRAARIVYDRVQFAIERARLLNFPIFAAERLESRADLLQGYNDDAGTPEFADAELALRRAVLVEDVRKAYYDLLRWDRRVVAVVTPRRGVPVGGQLAGPS